MHSLVAKPAMIRAEAANLNHACCSIQSASLRAYMLPSWCCNKTIKLTIEAHALPTNRCLHDNRIFCLLYFLSPILIIVAAVLSLVMSAWKFVLRVAAFLYNSNPRGELLCSSLPFRPWKENEISWLWSVQFLLFYAFSAALQCTWTVGLIICGRFCYALNWGMLRLCLHQAVVSPQQV